MTTTRSKVDLVASRGDQWELDHAANLNLCSKVLEGTWGQMRPLMEYSILNVIFLLSLRRSKNSHWIAIISKKIYSKDILVARFTLSSRMSAHSKMKQPELKNRNMRKELRTEKRGKMTTIF